MPFSLLIFFISITGILLVDVFGNYDVSQLSFFLTLLTPFFLFLSTKIEKKKIYIPLYETILYLLFIIFSIISAFFAIDKEIAFKGLLLYGAGYLFFVFCFNYQESFNKYFKWFLIIISLFFFLIFLVDKVFHLNLFTGEASVFYTGYQHNQLGNLLALSFIVTFPNILSFFFFIGVLFSCSRTTYFALFLMIIIQTLRNKIEKKSLIIGIFLILIIGLFYFLVSKNILFTKYKNTFGNRDIYFSYALSSIRELPLFGVGPRNFYYAASKRMINYGKYTTTAHNIILDILTENGVLAGTFFMLFILLIIYKRKKNTNFLLFLALSLMFMSDFIFRFNIFLILWFVFGGLTLDSKKKIKLDIIIPSLAIFIGFHVILFGQILLNQDLWRQSLLVYPLQKKAYETAIEENIRQKDKQQAYYFLQKYDKLFSQCYNVILKEIDYYQAFGEKNKVAILYQQAILSRPLGDIKTLKNMRDFYIELYGNEKANKKMEEILRQVKDLYLKNDRNSDLFKQINSFCLKANLNCLLSYSHF